MTPDDLSCMADEFTLKGDSWHRFSELLKAGKLTPDQRKRVRALLKRAEGLISAIRQFNRENWNDDWETTR